MKVTHGDPQYLVLFDEQGTPLCTCVSIEARDRLIEAVAEVEKLREERKKLRSIIESCCESVWEGCDIDGGGFQDWLVELGLLVEVPADEWFKENWGEDAKTMYSLVWSEATRAEGGE